MLNSSKEVVLWFIKICVEEHLMPNIDVSANNLISTIQHHIALVKHMHHVLLGARCSSSASLVSGYGFLLGLILSSEYGYISIVK